MLSCHSGGDDMLEVNVGLFRLPGLQLTTPNLISADIIEEMKEWTVTAHCGQHMTDELWSFKCAAHRDWFILRWASYLPELKLK